MRVGKRWAVAMFLLAVTPMHLYAQEEKAPAPAPAPVAAPSAVPDTGYQIGPGDVLNIEVWKDPVLTRLVTVLPDGKIAFPLVGEIAAEGKTVSQLKKEIEGRLARYVQDAVITVEVRQMGSLQIYVLGPGQRPRPVDPERERQRPPGAGDRGGPQRLRQQVPDPDLPTGGGEYRRPPVRLRRRDGGEEHGVEHPAPAGGRGLCPMTGSSNRPGG